MQTDVKVFTPELLTEIFPGLKVKLVENESVRYNLHTDSIDHVQLLKLAKIQVESNVNLVIRRYNKGLTITFTEKECSIIEPQGRHETIRDFFELVLPKDARIAAFDNTSKIRLDYPAKNLADAILQSFYISETPQGAEYWQDVILKHS